MIQRPSICFSPDFRFALESVTTMFFVVRSPPGASTVASMDTFLVVSVASYAVTSIGVCGSKTLTSAIDRSSNRVRRASETFFEYSEPS